jgi:hypothetical protein
MVGSPMAASSIHQRGRSKRFSHSLKVRNSRSLHFRFSLYRRSIRNAQCFEGSIGSRALAHKRNPPMGIIELVRRWKSMAICRDDAATDADPDSR